MTEHHYNDDGVECPKCLKVDRDAWEWLNGEEGCGEYECPACGHEFNASRTFSTSYKSWNKKGVQ